MKPVKITIKEELRKSNDTPFGCLIVNDEHIWRFDNLMSAEAAAKNLRRALAKEGE